MYRHSHQMSSATSESAIHTRPPIHTRPHSHADTHPHTHTQQKERVQRKLFVLFQQICLSMFTVYIYVRQHVFTPFPLPLPSTSPRAFSLVHSLIEPIALLFRRKCQSRDNQGSRHLTK